METRKEGKRPQKAPAARNEERKPRLQIVKLEQRIAPRITTNHNETLVRDPAKAPAAPARPAKPKLQIVKLEQRIAPRITTNHNEILVRDRAS